MFAGWCRRSGGESSPPDPESLLVRLDPYGGGVHHGTWSADDVVLVQSQLAAIPEPEQAPIPAVCRDTGNVLVGWLRLDNRDELLRFLGLDTSDLDSMSDSDLALRGYRAWGTDLAGHLEGEFALAIWSPSRREVYLARDATGRRPLYWSVDSSSVAFGSSLAALRGLPGVDETADPIWLARYIVGVPAPFGDHCTAFVGTSRLPPATWALIGPERVSREQYFAFADDSEWEDERDPRWPQAYRATLERCVGDHLRTTATLGMEASGGLDSSTLIALSAKLRPDLRADMHTFGFVRAPKEAELTLAPSLMWQVGANHLLTRWDGPPGVGKAQRREHIDRVLGHPEMSANASSYWPIYAEAQRQGVAVLLSGHGGDHAVTSYAWEAINEFAAHRRWGLIAREYPSRPRLRPVRAAQLRLGRDPLLQSWQRAYATKQALWEAWLASVLSNEVADAVIAGERALAAVSPLTGPDAGRSVNAHAIHDVTRPGDFARLEEGANIAASFGIEYRWPLFDRRLIQQFLTTPTIWKHGEGLDRYLHRRAVEGLIPDSIRLANTKNMGEVVRAAPGETPVPFHTPQPVYGDLHPDLQAILRPVDLKAKTAQITAAGVAARRRIPHRAERIDGWLKSRW